MEPRLIGVDVIANFGTLAIDVKPLRGVPLCIVLYLLESTFEAVFHIIVCIQSE